MVLNSDQKKYLITGAVILTALAIVFGVIFSRNDSNFLVKVQEQKTQNHLEKFLRGEKIIFENIDGEFYIENNYKTNDVLIKVIEGDILKESQYLLAPLNENSNRSDFLKAYKKTLLTLLRDYNPHLKYQFNIKVLGESFGEKIYGMEAIVSDVLKRDNIDQITNIIKSSLTPLVSLKLKIIDDQDKLILSKNYGISEEHDQLRSKIEKVVINLLKPILEDEKVYILSDFQSSNTEASIAVLIEQAKLLNSKEKAILSEAISKKITNTLKIKATVDIKEINSLSGKDESVMSSQDKFLYLLSITTILIFIYLLTSIYIKNKRRYILNLKAENFKKEQQARKERMEFELVEVCENIEAQIIHKTESSIKTFEAIIKNSEDFEVDQQIFSSGEVCAVVIKELEQEAKIAIFEGLGDFLAERMISFAAHENVKKVGTESKLSILKYFYEKLEAHNASLEFDDAQSGQDSANWELNHYVDLIKKAAAQKDYKELIKLFDQENPLFTALIFVSLNERVQNELWKIFNFDQKERISLSLVHSKNVSSKALEFAYSCFKQVS